MPNHYDPAKLIEVFVIFQNESGAPTNPTTVKLVLGAHDLSFTYTYGVGGQITRPATGDYRMQFKPATLFPGLYGPIWYRWIGDGTVTAAVQGLLVIDQPKVFAS